MQSLSISYDTLEQVSILKNYMHATGFEFLKVTPDFVDVLVTADYVEDFKTVLKRNGMNYTLMIENVKDAVTEEYITQQVERRILAKLRDVYASGQLSFTYYPNYQEVSTIYKYLIVKPKYYTKKWCILWYCILLMYIAFFYVLKVSLNSTAA